MLGKQTSRSVNNGQISKFVAKLGLLFLLMTKDMSKNWRLDCNVGPKSLLVSAVSVTACVGKSLITHVSFLGFAFASLAAFDTVYDSFALSACKRK